MVRSSSGTENFAARTGLRPNTEYIIEHRSLMKDDAGVVDSDTVEKYYTDDTRTVTRGHVCRGQGCLVS